MNQCLTDALNHCLTNAIFLIKKIENKLRTNPDLLAILKISERSQAVTYVALHVD